MLYTRDAFMGRGREREGKGRKGEREEESGIL